MAEKGDFVVLATGCLNSMHRCCVDVPEVNRYKNRHIMKQSGGVQIEKNFSDFKATTIRLEQMLQKYGFKAGDTYKGNTSNCISSAKLFVDTRELIMRHCDRDELSNEAKEMFDLIDRAKLIPTVSEG